MLHFRLVCGHTELVKSVFAIRRTSTRLFLAKDALDEIFLGEEWVL